MSADPIVGEIRGALLARSRTIEDIEYGRRESEHITAEAFRRLERQDFEAWKLLTTSRRLEDEVRDYCASQPSAQPYSMFEGAAVLEARRQGERVRDVLIESADGTETRFAVIDDTAWPSMRTLVRVRPSAAGLYRADMTPDALDITAGTKEIHDAGDLERKLDGEFADVVKRRAESGLWSENGLTDDLVIALRQGTGAGHFLYQFGTFWIDVTLHVFRQSGHDERDRGDICMIVEGMTEGGRFDGAGYLEAKKRDFVTGELRAANTIQTKRILQHAPEAQLLVYDLRASLGWQMVSIPLVDYEKFPAGARTPPMEQFGRPLSQQLTRRFFLGKDLARQREDVNGAIARGARYYVHARVGVGYSRDHAIDRHDEVQPAFLRLIERRDLRAARRTMEMSDPSIELGGIGR